MTTIPLPEGTVLVTNCNPGTADPVFAYDDDEGLYLDSTVWRERRENEKLDRHSVIPAPPGAVVPRIYFENGAMHVIWDAVQYVLVTSSGMRYSMLYTENGVEHVGVGCLTPEQAANTGLRDTAILDALDFCTDGSSKERNAARRLLEHSLGLRHSRPYFTAAALAKMQEQKP